VHKVGAKYAKFIFIIDFSATFAKFFATFAVNGFNYPKIRIFEELA